MKLSNKIKASLAVLISASCPALANNHVETSPSWDVIEAGYFHADIEDDSTPSGFNTSFLKSLGDNIYLTGRYRDASEDISIFGESVELGLSQISLGAGYKHNVSATTDVFAQVSYENVEATAASRFSSASSDENGLGAALGVRSMLTEKFEATAQIGYLDIEDESETSFGVSAYYYITESVAVGASYEVWDDVDFLGANLRYAF